MVSPLSNFLKDFDFYKIKEEKGNVFAIYDNKSSSQWTDPIDFLGTRGVFLHLSFE